MTLADHRRDSTRSSTADLARLPATDLLATLRAEGADVTPNLTRAELVAALLAHRLAHRRDVVGDGVLELLPEGFGFLRSVHFDYEPGPHDPFVSPSQVRALNLKPGHRLVGPLRAPKGGERFFALLHVDSVHGRDPGEASASLTFAARTPIAGTRPLVLAGHDAELAALGQLAPMWRGHRALLVAPPDWARLPFLTRVARALRAGENAPRVSLCTLAARPEDTAALRATFAGDDGVLVAGSTFDQPAARHLALAELAFARAQRDVEAGHDVVLVFDSLTALARSCQRELPPAGRWLAPGLEVHAVAAGKRLFAGARACAEGGSLSVLATALDEPGGSAADRAVLAEFRHCGNAEWVVDPALAGTGVELPFDLVATRTRPEDDVRPTTARQAAAQLRRELQQLPPAARAARLTS